MHGFWHKRHFHPKPSNGNDVRLSCDDEHLFRREFYVFWNSGMPNLRQLPDETAAVCHASVDDGNVVLTRVFHGCEHDVHRAEDKVLNWLHHENYVKCCKNMFLTIIMDSSPLYTFSRNLMEFKLLLDEQEILNEVDLKFVKLCHMEDLEEDREENKEGMRLLHKAGVKLSSLTEKDWSFLREHLLDPNGLYEQEKSARRVTHELEEILKK